MDNFYLSALIREIAPDLIGRIVGSVSITRSQIRLNLRPPGNRAVVVVLDPDWSGIFVTDEPTGRKRDQSDSQSQFALYLQENLPGATITRAAKTPGDRAVQLVFQSAERPLTDGISVILELTGRKPNAHVYDQDGDIVASLFPGEPRVRIEGTFESDGIEERRQLDAEIRAARRVEDSQQIAPLRSIPGPMWRTELMARAERLGPREATESLLGDLVANDFRGRVYSKNPLDAAGVQLSDPKTDFLLSHIELEQARGFDCVEFDSLSEAAEAYLIVLRRAREFNQVFSGIRQVVVRESAKRRATLAAIEKDRQRFGEPDRLKRAGELLLANLATARVSGITATVVDYFDPAQSEVEIELPEGATLQEAAAGYFNRYRKATRALAATDRRRASLQLDLERLDVELQRLDSNPVAAQLAEARKALEHLGVRTPQVGHGDKGRPSRKKESPTIGRRFQSSDGYEVVVGRNDRENDQITFRVARSDDIWMHAADYPGSHVLVRNPTRKAVPHRTIAEAAQLAAVNSQARSATKVAVHYTPRKFVSKPPKAKPGLVRLSSFKTILVEPRSSLPRMD